MCQRLAVPFLLIVQARCVIWGVDCMQVECLPGSPGQASQQAVCTP